MTTYSPVSTKAPFLWHGGDYNPEQWPSAIWDEDVRLMKKAGMTSATVGVFSWVSLQPDEDVYTFEWLDQVIDKLTSAGINIVLATPSAAHPAWMSQKYPDVLRSDDTGHRRFHSHRVNYCPNSPNYRRLSANIAQKLAERYGNHPNLLLWHISNEYGDRCLCDTCAAEFRVWLKEKYGTLDALNQAWWTPFWGHTYTAWEQILPPRSNGEVLTHGLTVDYFRFNNASQLACYLNEYNVLRGITPDVPITTNLMGFYKPLDYRAWAKEMDVVSWDCYPGPKHTPGEIAIMHDLMRGVKDGQPFLLMEQTPSSQNWQDVNAVKRPGVLRLWSYLAVAHGADSVMYFQWRRGRGGCEKLHGAVVEHRGTDDTRVFREVAELGAELEKLGDSIIGAETQAKIGLVFDWDTWHAVEDAIGPVRNKRYRETFTKHYMPFYKNNLEVDVIFPDSDLSGYSIIVAPMLYMVKAGFKEKVEAFVAAGGTFVATVNSGRVDETDLAFENGYPGPLEDVLGLWIEEIDALTKDQTNTLVMKDRSGAYPVRHLVDIVRPHDGTEILATFGSDFYAGGPALTKHAFGQGAAYYIASDPDENFLTAFYAELAKQHSLAPRFKSGVNVEVTTRVKNDQPIIFVLNHNAQPVTVRLDNKAYRNLLTDASVQGTLALKGYDVAILVEG